MILKHYPNVKHGYGQFKTKEHPLKPDIAVFKEIIRDVVLHDDPFPTQGKTFLKNFL